MPCDVGLRKCVHTLFSLLSFPISYSGFGFHYVRKSLFIALFQGFVWY